jgi:hypothetical protein
VKSGAAAGRTAPNDRIKARAGALIDAGPPRWGAAEIDCSRYTVTGLLDDLADDRNPGVYHASVATLYHMLANHYLRSRGWWGAHSKTIPPGCVGRRPGDPVGRVVCDCIAGHPQGLQALADDMLAATSGRLFDGYVAQSEPAWRRKVPDV